MCCGEWRIHQRGIEQCIGGLERCSFPDWPSRAFDSWYSYEVFLGLEDEWKGSAWGLFYRLFNNSDWMEISCCSHLNSCGGFYKILHISAVLPWHAQNHVSFWWTVIELYDMAMPIFHWIWNAKKVFVCEMGPDCVMLNVSYNHNVAKETAFVTFKVLWILLYLLY